jgi:hypothetical protein
MVRRCVLPTRKVRTLGGVGRWGNPGLGDEVIALLTDAMAARVGVAIDKTGALSMFDVFINNVGVAIPTNRGDSRPGTRRMIDITPTARSSRRGLALEHMNEGGRIVGGCCVGERAMAPILES